MEATTTRRGRICNKKGTARSGAHADIKKEACTDIKEAYASLPGGIDHVPLPGDLERIAEVAGLDAALKIAGAFRGTTLYVPDVFRQLREEAVKRDFDRGEPVRKIALRHRISERCVWQTLKRPQRPLSPEMERLLEA